MSRLLDLERVGGGDGVGEALMIAFGAKVLDGDDAA